MTPGSPRGHRPTPASGRRRAVLDPRASPSAARGRADSLPPSRRSGRRRTRGRSRPAAARRPCGRAPVRSGGRVVVIARGLPEAQRRALLHELWPSQAQEEHGAVHALDDGVGQVEHRRLRRVQVVQHDDQRPLGGEHLEQAAHRPRGVGPDRRADSEELRETVTDGRAVRLRDACARAAHRNCRGVPGWSFRLPEREVRRVARTSLPRRTRESVPRAPSPVSRPRLRTPRPASTFPPRAEPGS